MVSSTGALLGEAEDRRSVIVLSLRDNCEFNRET